MKLRLTQPGFETYTAQMGVTFFENGLSTTDVSVMDATRMAAVMGCEWENGAPANVGQIYLDNMHTEAPIFAAAGVPDALVVADVTVVSSGHTETSLGAIADAEGIAGLRTIADALGIKGNSIGGLITAVLKAQAA